jgi:hypothetical protein
MAEVVDLRYTYHMTNRGMGQIACLITVIMMLQAPIWAVEAPLASIPPESGVEGTGAKKTTLKLLADDGFALELRGGTVIWSGLDIPAYNPANPTGLNGINGANFLYPGFPILGMGVRIGMGPVIRLAPSLDLLVDEYLYRPDYDRAFRTNPETGSAVASGASLATVLGFLVSVPLWFDLPLTDRLVVSLAPGIAFYPRLAIMPIDNSTGIEKISENLNREAKWLYPQTGVAISYALGGWFAAGLQVQVMYPIYHAWSSDGLPFHDGLMVTGILAFDLFF